jgi:DNA-directed RNA polymerase specialized sigma24 family protein
MTAMNNPHQIIAKREELFIRFYKKAFPIVARYISRRGGSFDEARDVFQDALVIYYEKTVTIDTNETAYLIGVAKHLWLKRYRENNKNTTLENIDVTMDEKETNPSTKRLVHFLERAGSKCMELLKSFYYDQLPLADIASTFGFSGVRSATVQKYKCLEKVRETIKQKALQYEDFME